MTTVRPRRTNSKTEAQQGGALTGYEAEFWRMADALRGSMDAAEYKHVVLGLIFLKYISDAFQELHAWLESKTAEGFDPEDMDEYRGENIFWVPTEARWPHLKAQARQPTIGQSSMICWSSFRLTPAEWCAMTGCYDASGRPASPATFMLRTHLMRLRSKLGRRGGQPGAHRQRAASRLPDAEGRGQVGVTGMNVAPTKTTKFCGPFS